MAIVNQQDCHRLGHEATLKPLGANVIYSSSPSQIVRPYMNLVSVLILSPWLIIDVQDAVLLKIPIMENMFSTENELRLQNGSIGSHTSIVVKSLRSGLYNFTRLCCSRE